MNWYWDGSALIPFEMNQSTAFYRQSRGLRTCREDLVTGTQMAALADDERASALCVFNLPLPFLNESPEKFETFTLHIYTHIFQIWMSNSMTHNGIYSHPLRHEAMGLLNLFKLVTLSEQTHIYWSCFKWISRDLVAGSQHIWVYFHQIKTRFTLPPWKFTNIRIQIGDSPTTFSVTQSKTNLAR